MLDLDDVITLDRIKAYADLSEEWQADALADARTRAQRGAVRLSRHADDIAQCAAVYAAPTLATMAESATREERNAAVVGAFGVLDKRRADDDAPVDDEIWRDRIVAPDTYAPDKAYRDTARDMARAVLAGSNDRTRADLQIAAATELDGDQYARRVRGRGYVHAPNTVGRMGTRLRKATGASKSTAHDAMRRDLDDALTVAAHGLAWLQWRGVRSPMPAYDVWQAPLPPFITPDPTEGVGRPPFRNAGAVASPVVAVNADKTQALVYVWREEGKTEDGDPLRIRHEIMRAYGTEDVARLLSQPWPITEGGLTDTALDKVGDQYVTASTSRGPVKKGNPRKGNRRGSMGATVPTRRGKAGAVLPAGDMRPSVRPFRVGNEQA